MLFEREISKRFFDIAIAAAGLIIFSPVIALLGALSWIASPGSDVIYRGRRVGRYGKSFTLYKFRTMVQDASNLGPLVTSGDDPRITPLGRILRKTKLDELPSFWNVLKGDMSLVGPRPENEKSFALYTAAQRDLIKVRPGITSLATIKYRHEEQILARFDNLNATYYQVLQDKLRIELEYLKRQTFLSDLGVLLCTLLVIPTSKPTRWVLTCFGVSTEVGVLSPD